MASTSGGQSSANGNGEPDPKLEALMEKIRARAPNQKSWPDIIKGLRMAISDKRHFSEVNDKQLLQKYLDILQKAIKVNGHMSLLEKLSSVSRGVGLKYTSSAPFSECFLSTDMFYVEIKVDAKAGSVVDVTVVHDVGERTPCPEVAEIVNEGKFHLLTEHLEGLMNMYKINGDKKQKSRCFMALQSLEKDLNCLAQLQSSVHGVGLYIHKTPLGIIQPRIGGLPMKLIFFVAPIELIKKGKTRIPLTVESIMDNNLGHCCTIGIEPSSAHKLQTVPLMSVNKNNDGKSLPSFSALSNQNSSTLPACFTLCLQKPVPVSVATIKRIQSATGMELGDVSKCESMLDLIVKDFSNGKMTHKDDRAYCIILPNQQHCYYLTGNDNDDHMTGLMLTSVPFVHPTHVPQILQALRQQIAFNTLVGMVVRPEAKSDPDNSMIFEMNLVSMTHMSVIFENPVTDTMASVEVDFSDITNVKAQLVSAGGEDTPLVQDESLCTIINKTYSVPITMRCIMKHAAEILTSTQAPTPATPAEQALTPVPLTAPDLPPVLMDTLMPPDDLPQVPAFPDPGHHQNGSIYDYNEPYGSLEPPKGDLLDSIRAEKVAKNPMLASLLDQDNDSNEVQPVLPTLLQDSSEKQKQRKHRKRKADARSPGSSSGRSPKRKFSEDDHYKSQEGSFDMDSNDAFDLGQQVPFPSGVAVPSSLQSQTGGGNVSNPPVARRHDPESHVSKLKSSLESIIKQESKPSPRGELVALLTDDDVKPKVPAIGQPTTRRMSSQEAPSIDSVQYTAPDPIPHLDPDIFTTDDGAFTPTDFLGGSGKEAKSAGFQPETLDFNPDLLSQDFPDTMNENAEEMDLDACDANAFGTGVNRVAMAAAKLVTESASSSTTSTSTSLAKSESPQVSSSSSTKSSQKPSASIVAVSSAALATQVPAPIPCGTAPAISTMPEKKEVKKERKEDYRSEYKPAKKYSERKSLSERIGQPKPDLDALDLTALPIKENKPTSLKSLLKESLKEKSKDKDDLPPDDKGEFFTSTATGGTSLVISAKSSPSGSSKDSLKFSVKKDRIKKSSKEEDLKRKKDGSYFHKDRTSKKRKIDEDYKPRSEVKSELKPIKIRTSGGKMEIQPHSSSSSKSDKSKDSKPEIPKVTGPDYLKHVLPSVPKPKLPRIPLLSKQGKPNLLDKSTINPQGSKLKKPGAYSSTSTTSTTTSMSSTSITVSKSDSKLMTGKTPTIKLKPLVIPTAASSPSQQGLASKSVTSTTKTLTSTSPSSSKTGSISSPSRQSSTAPALSGSATPPIHKEPTTPPVSSATPPPGAGCHLNPGKGKSPVKSRSLSDVINKLKAKTGGTSSGGEEEDEKDRKKDDKKTDKDKDKDKERKDEKKIVKTEKTSTSSTKSSDEIKCKLKPDLKKVFSSPVKVPLKQYSSSSGSSSSTSSKPSSSSDKKSEVKKSSSSPGNKPPEKRSPSPSVKSEKKDKPKDEAKESKEKESSARDPRLEPKSEKRPSSTEVFRQPAADSPKVRESSKPEEKSSVKQAVSPVKESPDSPDDLVIDLPLTPSSTNTKTIPMERSSPMPGKASPVPLPTTTSSLPARVSSSSPVVRTSSPLVPARNSPSIGTAAPRPRSASPRPSSANSVPASGTSSPAVPVTAASGAAPASKVPITTSPVSNPSPCHIDDDLMDEALMGCADESK